MADSIIYLEGVTVDFDGFKALTNVNFYIEPGELRVVIGPNGAGKTTLLDVICGKTRPVHGRVILDNLTDILALPEYKIAQRGVGRKFQTPSILSHLSVAENIELALYRKHRGVFATLFDRKDRSANDRIYSILETVRLIDRRDHLAENLSHGEKQWLEIGMVLAQEPKVLLIDEPAAGLSDTETRRTGELLLSLAGRYSIIVIEHDMEFVKQIAKKVTVLHEGKVLCEGPFERIKNDPRVIEIYLGGHKANAAD
ncbi:MAG TPA: urea ABC transporter ATP-binding protein UrtD [Edaphobacter sp.]|nr:urea ABC transporter ATP-binding protein UrtD [Edaphobacter sp.]